MPKFDDFDLDVNLKKVSNDDVQPRITSYVLCISRYMQLKM